MAGLLTASFGAQPRFLGPSSKRNTSRPVKVWSPPIYDLSIFEPNTAGKPSAEGSLAIYNQRVPIVRKAAEALGRRLQRQNPPPVTLYPCPNPLAIHDISIEVPLGPGQTDEERKAAAELDKASLLKFLRKVRGMYVSEDGKVAVFIHERKPYRVHLITQLTEREAAGFEVFA